jgi:hypothetical protein
MASFKFQLQGFSPAFQDASIKLINTGTGAAIERKPFLDGSLVVPELDPGQYEMEVRHPNLVLPIDRRRIKLFPQIPPTYVPVTIDPVLFKDSPIRDVPDVDLTPVQQTAQGVQDRLARVGGKLPGEAIKSADWNALVSALSELAGAVLDLTRRVTPIGHNHPEIAEKIDEVEDNLRNFSESFGRSLLAMQRKLEADNLHAIATDAFAGTPSIIADKVFTRIAELPAVNQSDPRVFSKRLATTGAAILNAVSEAASAAGTDAEAFLAKPEVKAIQEAASNYVSAGVADAAHVEMLTYQRNFKLWKK